MSSAETLWVSTQDMLVKINHKLSKIDKTFFIIYPPLKNYLLKKNLQYILSKAETVKFSVFP